MNDSSSIQFNEGELDYSYESNEVDESRIVIDEQFIPKAGMTFKTVEEARKFYKDYYKLADFSDFSVRNVSEQDDAKEFGKYLLRMKEKNQNFFYELNLEDDCSIKNAFWADARSRVAYEYFGDVVSFDTTYNTNRYNLVFGSFVGVNHHGHSTLLGCSLLKNEDIQSFKWLLECWLRCMGGKTPKDILTDQCASMQKAFETCMPTTIHRWCIWHIMKKIPRWINDSVKLKQLSSTGYELSRT